MYAHLNDIHITPHLAARLAEIEGRAVATVVAPMAYGKTTAIRHWQAQTARARPETVFLRQNVLGEGVGELWQGFCRLLARHDAPLAGRLREAGFPRDIRGLRLAADLWEESRPPDAPPVWWILDDVHLLERETLAPLITALPDGPESFRMVLLSRNRILTAAERMRLGRHLCEIRMNDLALTETEMRRYAKNCGLPLTDAEAARMGVLSEGWIGLIYLFLRSRTQGGDWGFDAPNVFSLIDQVMLEPLSETERDCLLSCSVAEEFSQEQAAFLWAGRDGTRPGLDAGALLTRLSENNAFITVSEEGLYRCHHMLLQCLRQRFKRLPEEERRRRHARLGDWHLRQGACLEAMHAYRRAEDWPGLLEAVVADMGNSLDGEQREALLDWTGNCPEDLLRARPEALLVLTLACFTVGDIPGMLRMNELMLAATQQAPGLTEAERNDYLGESLILSSFLEFNSITGMSAPQRRAAELMTRPTRCLNLNSPWTFGAPSVLSLYHRDVGALDEENEQMRDCMPWYGRVSAGHGRGAEHVFAGETSLLRGDFAGARIEWHRAVAKAREKAQHSILAAATFLAARLDLLDGDLPRLRERLDALRDELKRAGQLYLLTTADLCEAWVYALLGRPDYAPDWVADAPAASLKGPAWPSFLTVRDQLRLARGEHARLVALGERRAALFEETHALLPAVYLHVQLAGANLGLGRRDDALRELDTALSLAAPDGLRLPFAENGPFLGDLLGEVRLPKGTRAPLLALTKRFAEAREAVLRRHFPARWDADLTDREREIARLAARRLSVREIADRLYVSENTVKTHLKRVYDKLGVGGTNRNKRAALERIVGE